ncbi:MAG: hypothetical protein IJ744_11220 [Lachnospiraceae bacterium]|nr:hypothetical protein [Lachnospiraceae bacterium]
MNSFGWFWVALVIGMILVIVYNNIKKTKEEDAPAVPITKVPKPSPKPVEKTEIVEEVPTYVSIYVYSPSYNIINCKYCDGENNVNAKTCCICGSVINR